MASPLDCLLDSSVVLSFDGTGYRRHAKGFAPGDLDVALSGRTALVTGANSGIGRATAAVLARLGARVILGCRDAERGREAAASIRAEAGGPDLRSNAPVRSSLSVRCERLDVADGASVKDLARRLRGIPLHVLVHNAGVLPDRRQETTDGLERTLATNLAGPHLLTRLLLPSLSKAGRARVVFVSSGGMYTQRLDVASLEAPPESPFDGVAAYARTKRASVVLSGLWAERCGEGGVTFNAMHPGWADTPGVRTSLPLFWSLTRGILRTAEEGADTVVWLAASAAAEGRTGEFWFDRRVRSPWLLPFTRESEAERARLWTACEAWADRMDRGG